MLAVWIFLSALGWGTLIGAKFGSDGPRNKIHLPQAGLVMGNVLFSLPGVTMLLVDQITGRMWLVLGLCIAAGALVGIKVGSGMYWLE